MNTDTELPQEFYLPKVTHYNEREECLVDIVMVVLILGYLKINILKKNQESTHRKHIDDFPSTRFPTLLNHL